MDHQVELLRAIDHRSDLSSSPKLAIIRYGSHCPHCEQGVLDYNGMLDLECDRCGYSLVEAAGCS